MKKKWKVGLIGCGAIADGNYMPEIKAMDNTQMVSVCDIIPDRAREFSKKYDVPEWYDHIDNMLAQTDIEILVNTTSIPAHYEINMKALEAGLHLYSQKPIASTAEEVTSMITAAEKNDVKISASPVHMLRPVVQEVKRIIAEGIIGKVSYVRAPCSHGGPEYFQFRDVNPSWFYGKEVGPLRDLGVHGLHMVTGVLGPARSVASMSGISEKERTIRSGKHDGEKIRPQVDDNTLLLLNFGSGTFAFIDSTYCVKASRSSFTEIFGSKGTIVMHNSGENPLELFLDDRSRELRGWTNPMKNWGDFQQSSGVKDLITAVEKDRIPVLTAEQARHVIEIMNKAQQAARTGKEIKLNTAFSINR